MNNILIAGFKGNKNSSKVLLDNIRNLKIDKLYLDNNFSKSEKQLEQAIKTKKYDIIYAFGQKPLIKSIYIETCGQKNNKIIETNFDYLDIKKYLNNYYKIKISNNAGKYFCNNIYFYGLNYIIKNNLGAKIIFIHIPYLSNADILKLAKLFDKYLVKQ